MESLNLNTLANSLPNDNNLANSEKELLNNFKGKSGPISIGSEQQLTSLLFVAAALSITTLYRSSRQTKKRAYNAGYGAACHDLLLMIQQGVSVGGIGPAGPTSSSGESSNEMTIGKVMDWIEARLEAVKSREEEEDEEEERERTRNGASANTTTSTLSKPSTTTKANTAENVPTVTRAKDQVRLLSNFFTLECYLIVTSACRTTSYTTLPYHNNYYITTTSVLFHSRLSIPSINPTTHSNNTSINAWPHLHSSLLQTTRSIPHRLFELRHLPI